MRPPNSLRQTEIEAEIARANVAHKEGALTKAQLALSRTRVVAPLSGTIGRPPVAPGAFVEAIKDMVLAEIAQLDPMEVSFHVPYVERQRALDKAGTSDADEVFDKSTLSLELPSDRIYDLSGKPHGEEIDQSTDVNGPCSPIHRTYSSRVSRFALYLTLRTRPLRFPAR
jgi:hypothetical protein